MLTKLLYNFFVSIELLMSRDKTSGSPYTLQYLNFSKMLIL